MFDLLSIKERKQYVLSKSPETYIQKFEDGIFNFSDKLIIQTANNKVFIRIPKNEFKWWSPEMTLSFEKQGDKSHIRELVGPNPSIFTFTVFMVFGAFILLTFASMMFYSQILMEKPLLPSLTIGILGIIVFMLSMVAFSYGKRKAKLQVEKIKQFTSSILNESVI